MLELWNSRFFVPIFHYTNIPISAVLASKKNGMVNFRLQYSTIPLFQSNVHYLFT